MLTQILDEYKQVFDIELASKADFNIAMHYAKILVNYSGMQDDGSIVDYILETLEHGEKLMDYSEQAIIDDYNLYLSINY